MKDLLPVGSTYFLCSLWGRGIRVFLASEDFLSVQFMGLSQGKVDLQSMMCPQAKISREGGVARWSIFTVSLPFPSIHLPIVCIQLPESGASKALSPGQYICLPRAFQSCWHLSTGRGGGILGFPFFFTLKPNSSRIHTFFLCYLLSCPAVGSPCSVLLLDLIFFPLEALCFLSQCEGQGGLKFCSF